MCGTTLLDNRKGRNSSCGPSAWRCRQSVLRLLGEIDERLEAGGIVDGDLGKHLAVQDHASVDEPSDELGVADALRAGRRIDAGDPELTEVALLELAVDRRQATRAIDSLGGLTEVLAARTAEALGELKAAAAAFTGSRCVCCT